jgi:putative lipoprotein
MMRTLVLVAVLSWPPRVERWFGADKVKHFLLSALVHSGAYSAARATGLEHAPSQAIGGGTAMTIGIWKEVHDRRVHKPFSIEDLVWDATGALAAASLLNGAR